MSEAEQILKKLLPFVEPYQLSEAMETMTPAESAELLPLLFRPEAVQLVQHTRGVPTGPTQKAAVEAPPNRQQSQAVLPKTKAPPMHFFLSLAVDSELDLIIEKQGEELTRRFSHESSDEITKGVWLRLLELSRRVKRPRLTANGRPENTAVHLASMATAAANFLEDLSRKGAIAEIQLAAMRKHKWPVNLAIGTKMGRNGKVCRTLESQDRAKDYLIEIRLGEAPAHALKHSALHDVSPFRRAAELLMQALIDLRRAGIGACTGNTSWAGRLLGLDLPMTTRNNSAWWTVAKEWLDDQWDSDRQPFEPLIRCLNLANRSFTPSMVRRRVIDDSLKKAFKSIAVSPPL